MARRLLLALTCLLLAGPAWSLPLSQTEAPSQLRQVQDEVHRALARLDQRLAKSADKLAQNGLSGSDAYRALEAAWERDPFVVNVLAMDAGGKVRQAAPARFGELIGADIGGQEHIKRLLDQRRPVMSQSFTTKEDIQGVVVARPILAADGRLLGGVSALLRPSLLLGRFADPVLMDHTNDLWAMDTAGRILFDPDPEEIGLNLFTAPVYQLFPELIALGRRIAATAAGEGVYTYLDRHFSPKAVAKQGLWTSVGLHGTWWRLVLMRVEPGGSARAGRDLPELDLPSLDQALDSLAAAPELLAALAKGDASAASGFLRDFFLDHSGLYSVQWCDARGVVRAGYPVALSLVGHDLGASGNPEARRFLAALQAGQAASLDMELQAGGRGRFRLRPVRSGGRELGALYSILVLP